MNGWKRVAAAALLASAAGSAFWMLSSAKNPASEIPAETSPRIASPTSEPEAGATAPADTTSENRTLENRSLGEAMPEPPRPSADTSPDRAAEELMLEMAAVTYRRQGERYVDYLVSSGVAPSDGRRIVEQGFRDAVACSFEAMRAQAELESVPFDDVLYAIRAELYGGDGPLITALIDFEAVREREMPCVLNVLQETGIPPAAMEEIQRGQRPATP